MANSSMPREDFERLSSLRREHELIDLQILQEETRAKILKENRQALENRVEALKRENWIADEVLNMAKSKKTLLLETQIQLSESVQILEKDVAECEASYLKTVAESEAKKREWNNHLNASKKSFDDSIKNIWCKFPGFDEFNQNQKRVEDLRMKIAEAKAKRSKSAQERTAASVKKAELDKQKSTLDLLQEQLQELNLRKTHLEKTKDELMQKKLAQDEEEKNLRAKQQQEHEQRAREQEHEQRAREQEHEQRTRKQEQEHRARQQKDHLEKLQTHQDQLSKKQKDQPTRLYEQDQISKQLHQQDQWVKQQHQLRQLTTQQNHDQLAKQVPIQHLSKQQYQAQSAKQHPQEDLSRQQHPQEQLAWKQTDELANQQQEQPGKQVQEQSQEQRAFLRQPEQSFDKQNYQEDQEQLERQEQQDIEVERQLERERIEQEADKETSEEEERSDASQEDYGDEEEDSGISNTTNMDWTLPATSKDDEVAMISAMSKTSVAEIPKKMFNFVPFKSNPVIAKQLPTKVNFGGSLAESTPMIGLRLNTGNKMAPPDITPIASSSLFPSSNQFLLPTPVNKSIGLNLHGTSVPFTPPKDQGSKLSDPRTPSPNRNFSKMQIGSEISPSPNKSLFKIPAQLKTPSPRRLLLKTSQVNQPRADQRRFLFAPKSFSENSRNIFENSPIKKSENVPNKTLSNDGDVNQEPRPKVARLGSSSDFFSFGGTAPDIGGASSGLFGPASSTMSSFFGGNDNEDTDVQTDRDDQDKNANGDGNFNFNFGASTFDKDFSSGFGGFNF